MSRTFDARETRFGRYFEDFEVGDVYKHWPGKTITEADDHLFCMITMNHHPLHIDAHYAETETQFKKNVVVGNLVEAAAEAINANAPSAVSAQEPGPEALPNPSIEARSNGLAPGPRGTQVHHVPRGPGTKPSSPPHVKR